MVGVSGTVPGKAQRWWTPAEELTSQNSGCSPAVPGADLLPPAENSPG